MSFCNLNLVIPSLENLGIDSIIIGSVLSPEVFNNLETEANEIIEKSKHLMEISTLGKRGRCLTRLIGRLSFKGINKRIKTSVVGPELENFFIKALMKERILDTVDDLTIYPIVTKDNDGFRYRTSEIHISSTQKEMFKLLLSEFNLAHSDLIAGNNFDLVTHLNSINKTSPDCEIREIYVYEGGVFGPGRLETITFSFTIGHTIQLIEESNYVLGQ